MYSASVRVQRSGCNTMYSASVSSKVRYYVQCKRESSKVRVQYCVQYLHTREEPGNKARTQIFIDIE